MDDRLKQHLLLAREHYTNREFDKAEPLLMLVLNSHDRFADVHDMLGVIAHAAGDFDGAELHFERALEINPTYTEAALNLAVTYNDGGKYEKAREVYARIKGGHAGAKAALDPFARGKLANMHAALGQAYADAGLAHDAIFEYERAVGLCPDFADLQTKLGSLLREASEFGRAREHYEAAIRARPGFVPARIQLGITLFALGEASEAERHWRHALELEPENAHAKMYLRTLAAHRSKSSMPPPG